MKADLPALNSPTIDEQEEGRQVIGRPLHRILIIFRSRIAAKDVRQSLQER